MILEVYEKMNLLKTNYAEGKKAAIALSTRELCTAAAAGDLREVKRLVKKVCTRKLVSA